MAKAGNSIHASLTSFRPSGRLHPPLYLDAAKVRSKPRQRGRPL